MRRIPNPTPKAITAAFQRAGYFERNPKAPRRREYYHNA